MRRLLFRRVCLTCAVLWIPAALGAFILLVAAPAWPAEVAPKGDLLATAPMPQAKPVPAPTCSLAPFSVFAETPGWRALTGDKAVKYMDLAFNNHPLVDAVAFVRAGDKVVVVIGLNGCAIGRQAIPANGHQKVMELAFGIVA